MAKREKDKDKKKKKLKRAEMGFVAPQLAEEAEENAENITPPAAAEAKPAKPAFVLKSTAKAPGSAAKRTAAKTVKPAAAAAPAVNLGEGGEGILAKSRVLRLYTRLIEGKSFNREQVAQEYHCSIRSIQRDIDEIKDFLAERGTEEGVYQTLEYDHKVHGYRLEPPMVSMLSNEEAFMVLKILLESRALVKEEMKSIIDRLIDSAVPKINQAAVKKLIGNEREHYVQPRHGKKLADNVWKLGNAIKDQLFVTVEYQKLTGAIVKRKLKPVGILVSEYYFYLLAFIENAKQDSLPEAEKYPAVYRIDRIQSFKVGRVHFEMPYKAFEEGEFRKRVQFMFTGKLQKLKFICKTIALEAVLDRLPTAKVLESKAGETLIEAEVFGGQGLQMWLRSQGDNVRIVE